MTSQNLPQTPVAWADFLTRQPLPATLPIGKLVHRKLVEGSPSFTALAELVNRDPVTSCLVMCRANQVTSGEPSKTLDHAISMIGTEALDNLALTLTVVNLKDPKGAGFHYLRSLATSLLAADIARHMVHRRKRELMADVYWAALMRNLPVWLMWYFAPDLMRVAEHAHRELGQDRTESERLNLGCTLREISQHVLRRLKPHPLALRATDPQYLPTGRQLVAFSRLAREKGSPPRPEEKELALLSNEALFVVHVANQLAGAAMHDWYSRETLRYVRIASAWAGESLPTFAAEIHRLAVDLSRQHPFRGILLPGARLLLPPRPRRHRAAAPAATKTVAAEPGTTQSLGASPPAHAVPPASPSIPPPPGSHRVVTKTDESLAARRNTSDTPVPAPASAPATKDVGRVVVAETADAAPATDAASRTRQGANRRYFEQMTEMMLTQPFHFNDLHELMNAAVQTLHYGLGLPVATSALVNAQQTRLRSYYSAGVKGAGQRGQFDVDLTQKSLFNKLLEKPASIWMKPSTSAPTWAALPASFRERSHPTEHLLTSVFVRNKPVAIFYADGGDIPCSEYEYRQFKQLCSAVSQVLLSIADRRKGAPG